MSRRINQIIFLWADDEIWSISTWNSEVTPMMMIFPQLSVFSTNCTERNVLCLKSKLL